MPCTTVLVGKRASNDRSTMIARTDDGHFDVKKLIVVGPAKQPKTFKTAPAHVLCGPLRAGCAPSVSAWAVFGMFSGRIANRGRPLIEWPAPQGVAFGPQGIRT